MESLWRKQTRLPSFKNGRYNLGDQDNVHQNEINEDSWDVIVIGAGMAGLLTAYYLRERGKRVLILEADEVASGQTERTTAKITSQHGLKYSKLIKQAGIEKARLYAQANEAAIREYERLIRIECIDCQFEKTASYLYSKENEAALQEEARAANTLGIDAFFTKETELPFPVAGAVCFCNQAQFSPLKFVKYICADLEIWENTKVVGFKDDAVITEKGTITADKIVVATHYPIFNIPGFYFLRQHQERSYVLALSGCDTIKSMYYGIDRDGLSFRQAGEYLLLGGGAHRTGKGVKEGMCGYHGLTQAAKQYFPEGKEEMRWAAQDCMPHDGIPFIGRYSVFKKNLYVVTGFQKWGMTSSMIAAMILRDELCGISNPYTELFTPQRFLLRASMGNLLKDIGMSVQGLTKGLFCTMTKKAPRCPHMGCELVWNPEEQSWDCPCHGSRYDKDGKLLDNPSKKSITTSL